MSETGNRYWVVSDEKFATYLQLITEQSSEDIEAYVEAMLFYYQALKDREARLRGTTEPEAEDFYIARNNLSIGPSHGDAEGDLIEGRGWGKHTSVVGFLRELLALPSLQGGVR